MGTQFNMLVYNIKRSINILGVSDLIAKLKMELTYKQCLFVFITNILGFQGSITNQLQCLKNKLALERVCAV
jgi:hypothetical protein